jgi:cytochrome c553
MRFHTDSAGTTSTNATSRWDNWKCPHPRCNFVIPPNVAYAPRMRRMHLALHGDKTKAPKYSMSAADKKAARVAKYTHTANFMEAITMGAKVWMHNFRLDISLEENLARPPALRKAWPITCDKCHETFRNRSEAWTFSPVCGLPKCPLKSTFKATSKHPAKEDATAQCRDLAISVINDMRVATRKASKNRYWHRLQARALPTSK